MIQIVEQTREQKFKMYNRLSKKNIINILLNAEEMTNLLLVNVNKEWYSTQYPPICETCGGTGWIQSHYNKTNTSGTSSIPCPKCNCTIIYKPIC